MNYHSSLENEGIASLGVISVSAAMLLASLADEARAGNIIPAARG